MLDSVIAAAPSATCHASQPMDRLLAVMPWIAIVILISLVTGLAVTWISLKADDNRWEATRHGLTAAITSFGPLLAVVTLVSTLLTTCH
ncbi:hypothetical protein [Streptomyces sp. NPDC001135]